jgi:hypothetical protein
MESASVGLVYTNIELISGDDLALVRRGFLQENQIHRCTVRAMVDSGGSTMLAIPEFVKTHLELPPLRCIEADLADLTVQKLPK